jgi:hypothetical protein
LRCFEQTRRFGIDFLYPTERYVNALTRPYLCFENADLSIEGCPAAPIANPLYFSHETSEFRTPRKVVLASAVGVPWQDLALSGVEAGEPLVLMSGAEMRDTDAFALVTRGGLGGGPPLALDPFMVESVQPRSGEHPITGELLQPPTAPEALANSINGPEWSVSGGDDLQYACIFPLPEPRNCAEVDGGCDCAPAGIGADERPVCQDPVTGDYGAVQYFSKAYPGLRHLEILRGVTEPPVSGPAGMLMPVAAPGSICARNVEDGDASDFGYRPLMSSILRRLVGPLPRMAR